MVLANTLGVVIQVTGGQFQGARLGPLHALQYINKE